MSVSDDIDRSLVEFAQKIAAIPTGIANEDRSEEPRPKASDAPSPAAADAGGQSSPPPLPIDKPSTPDIPPTPPVAANSKQLRSADEIAGIIMKSLRTIEGCPVIGLSVTVYGSNPWNAMLTIRPEAGSRVNRELWCSRVHDIGVQLRNEFDVADASTNGSV
jgi:hypothetical protein